MVGIIGLETDTESLHSVGERMTMYETAAHGICTPRFKDSHPSLRLKGMCPPSSGRMGATRGTFVEFRSLDSSRSKHLKMNYFPIEKARGASTENIPDFIDAYLNNNIRFEEGAYLELRKECSKILKSDEWTKVYGEKTVDEIMDEIRGRR